MFSFVTVEAYRDRDGALFMRSRGPKRPSLSRLRAAIRNLSQAFAFRKPRRGSSLARRDLSCAFLCSTRALSR